MDGSSTDRDGWELQPGRGFPRSTTSKKTTTIAQSSSRSSAGSVSGASNAAGPAQSVAGRSPIDNAARNGQPTMQSSTSTSGRGNLNTSNAVSTYHISLIRAYLMRINSRRNLTWAPAAAANPILMHHPTTASFEDRTEALGGRDEGEKSGSDMGM